MNIEADSELRLYNPGTNIVDIDGSDSDDCVETDQVVKKVIDIPEIVKNLEIMFEAKPFYSQSQRPFKKGDQVCFRPRKTDKWQKGEIIMKNVTKEGEETFSISVKGDSSLKYEVPDAKHLIKSNQVSLEVLNNLDSKETSKPQKRRAPAVRKVKGFPAKKKEDPPRGPMVRVNNVPKKNCSDRIACVEQTGTEQLDTNQNKELSMAERIKMMFQDNRLGTSTEAEKEVGPDTSDQVSLDVMMKSLSEQQVRTLLLSAQEDLVRLSSSSSSYEIVLGLLELSDETSRTSLCNRLEDEAVLFPLLQTEAGLTVLLRGCLRGRPESQAAVWLLLQPLSLALLARESTSYLIQRLAPEIPHIIHSLVGKDQQIRMMMMTSHCIGVLEVICQKSEDSDLLKLTDWIISNLSLVISTEAASQASCEVLQEMLRRQEVGGLRSLVTKLVEEQDGDGGLPLLVRAAQDSAGHNLVVSLLRRAEDCLPQDCYLQLKVVVEAHRQKLKTKKNSRDEADIYGCVVLLAAEGFL